MEGGSQNSKVVPRPVGAAKYQTLLDRIRTRLEVFIAGPYLEPSWQAAELSDKQASLLLRATLREHVRDQGNDVVLGEHRGVAEITTESIPSVGKIAASELALVKSADAIILIPDSPGSFCEAGAWSMMKDVPQKTLIFPNAAYETEPGYLQGALLPHFRNQYARVEWLDYSDHEKAISLVDDFLSGIADRKVMEGLARRNESGFAERSRCCVRWVD